MGLGTSSLGSAGLGSGTSGFSHAPASFNREYSLILDRLLKNLNHRRVWNIDPNQLFVFSIEYVGGSSGTFTIKNGVLRTRVANPDHDLKLDLPGQTIQQIHDAIDASPFFNAGPIVAGYENLDGKALLETEEQDLFDSSGHGGDLYIHESTLWDIFKSVACDLDRARRDTGEALKQMNVRTSEGLWATYWCFDYLNTTRIEGETDAQYTSRTIVTILRPKANNVALELLIADALGVSDNNVIVKDCTPLILNRFITTMIPIPSPSDIWDQTFGRMLGEEEPGACGHFGCFTVFIFGSVSYTLQEIETLVDKYKAAGTCVTVVLVP